MLFEQNTSQDSSGAHTTPASASQQPHVVGSDSESDAGLLEFGANLPDGMSDDIAQVNAALYVPAPQDSVPKDDVLAAAGYLTNEEIMSMPSPPVLRSDLALCAMRELNLDSTSQREPSPDKPCHASPVLLDANVVQRDQMSHILDANTLQYDFNSHSLENRTMSQCEHLPEQKDFNSQDPTDGDSLFGAITAFYERQTAPLPPEVTQQDLVDLCEQTLPGWWQQYLRRKRRLQQSQPPKKRRGL